MNIIVANPNKTLNELISEGKISADCLPNSLAKKLLLYGMGKETKINVLKEAVKEDNEEVFFEFVKKMTDKKYETVLAFLVVDDCARYGRIEMLKYLIDGSGQDWDYIAELAAEGDHSDIVELAVDNGVTNFSKIAYTAARKGHGELVQRMLDLGADDYSLIACGAAVGCNKKLLTSMVEKSNQPDWGEILNHAAEGGDKNIFNYVLYQDDYDQSEIDCSMVVCSAAQGGHRDIIDIATGNMLFIDWNLITCWAASGGHGELVKSLIKKGANDHDEIVRFATDFNQFEIVLDYIDEVPDCYGYIGNEACKKGNITVIRRIIDKCDNKEISNFMSMSAYYGYRNIAEYCVEFKKRKIDSEFEELCKTKPLD